MMARMFIPTHARRAGDEQLPTATEINRIRHTISMLITHEVVLLNKMAAAKAGSGLMLQNDICGHALQIVWGWQQLRRLVETLSDSCFDKQCWLSETRDGLERSAILYADSCRQLAGQL